MLYQFDAQSANKADVGGSKLIREIGAYTGKIIRAEDIHAKSGARGIEIMFEATDGRKATTTVWVLGRDGAILPGYDTIAAILFCLRRKAEIDNPRQMNVPKYSFDDKAEIMVNAPCFPELMGKPIGLMLFTEDYENQSGELRTRMNIGGVFEPSTKLTASEIVAKKTRPEMYDALVSRLKHRPLRNKPASPMSAAYRDAYEPANAPNSASSPAIDFDDDIPFNSAA